MSLDMHYVMDPDGTTRAVPLDEYIEFLKSGFDVTRRIGKTQVGTYDVSTVFLSHNHQWGDGPPLLFETMVFNDADSGNDLYCDRYATKAEAEAGHARVVAALEAGTPVGDIEVSA